MKKNVLIILLITLGFFAKSQDTITLITGKKIFCKVTNIGENNITYLRDVNSPHSKISKLKILDITYKDGTKLEFRAEQSLAVGINAANDKVLQSGTFNITGLNYAYNSVSFGIQTIIGKQFNPIFSLGFGIGFDKYQSISMVPLIVDARANIFKGNTSPYLSVGLGYSIAFSNSHLVNQTAYNGITNIGGLFFNPSVGVKHFISSKKAIMIGIGYKMQQNSLVTHYQYNTQPNSGNGSSQNSSYIEKQSWELFNLYIGVSFF